MKKQSIKGWIVIGIKALLINSVIIFSLPLWYDVMRGDFFSMNRGEKRPSDVVKVNLETPPKKVEKIKPRVRERNTELNQRRDSISDRFRLDLGVNAGGGVGAAISGDTGGNIIFSQNEVEVDPIRLGGRNPVVPESFSDLGQSGRVEVEVVIDESGNVVSAQSIFEDPQGLGLKESVITALKTWQFRPAKVNRAPVKVRVIIPFLF